MTQKALKIIFILLLIFSFCITYVYATNIDLDLPGTSNNPTDQSSNVEDQNLTDNTINTPDDGNTNASNDDNVNTEALYDSPSTPSDSETLNPGAFSSAPQDGLSVSNIINILLITVGVVIILLAIAILIRLRG